MRVDTAKVKRLCAERGVSIDEALKNAGVSRNAYYSIARRRTVLPRSVTALADELAVSAGSILSGSGTDNDDVLSLLKDTDRIVKRHRTVDRDNVRHTLLLLREKPVDRLRRALLRAQGPDIQ